MLLSQCAKKFLDFATACAFPSVDNQHPRFYEVQEFTELGDTLRVVPYLANVLYSESAITILN
jgi:hypothetical protein